MKRAHAQTQVVKFKLRRAIKEVLEGIGGGGAFRARGTPTLLPPLMSPGRSTPPRSSERGDNNNRHRTVLHYLKHTSYN